MIPLQNLFSIKLFIVSSEILALPFKEFFTKFKDLGIVLEFACHEDSENVIDWISQPKLHQIEHVLDSDSITVIGLSIWSRFDIEKV